MKVLELDAGNSRLKWRLLEKNNRVSHGFLTNSTDWQYELSGLLEKIGQIDCARASVVSGNERFQRLSAAVDQHFNVPLLTAEVKPQWRGVRAAYPGLGVDRWLAMLAANHHDGWGGYQGSGNKNRALSNKLVVSCGTAITIDLLSGAGDHLGGYIVPGIGLMKKMLHQNTAQLPRVEAAASTMRPGQNSVDCINNGILAMAVAMINAQQEMYVASCESCVVYLTGGDADLVQPHIRGECCYFPELVMDGLALAFDEVMPG